MQQSGRSRWGGRSALVLAVLAAGAGLLSAAAGFEEQRTLSTSDLTIYNVVGEVQVEGHDGSSFEVRVNVRGDDASRERIRIETHEGASSSLAVVFPLDEERDYVYPKLGSGSRSSFSFSNDDSWLSKLMGGLGRRRITVRGSGRGMEAWADVEVLVPSGSTLTVKHGVGEIEARNVDGELTLDSHSGSVTAVSIDGDLLIDTGSGRVHAEGIRGEAVIDTGSGSVEVADFQGRELNIDTGSGSVRLDRIDTEELAVDTGSGGVTASGVRTESADIDTGSGGITLRLDHMGPGDYRLDTGSGSITLEVPHGASADVKAETGSGGIDIDLAEGVRINHKERNEASFRIGGEGGARVEIDTGSGGIRISRTD